MNEDDINLDDDVKKIAFYLQAGSHSTANSMTHTFHEISNGSMMINKSLIK